MEHSDISRRNMLKGGALGVGGLGAVSVAGPAAAAPAGLPAAAAGGAVDIFLKIDGIPGESRDSRHKDEIDVASFSWGVARESDKGPGRPALQDLNFTTGASKASPALMVAAAGGTRIPRALLTMQRAGSSEADFYKMELEGCTITSYQTGGSAEVPFDQVSLAYTKVTFSYYPQNADGRLAPPVVVTYP
jgi:type VI secretion system secreted protein Hcp